jgi:hypothetical protein
MSLTLAVYCIDYVGLREYLLGTALVGTALGRKYFSAGLTAFANGGSGAAVSS